MPKVWVLSTLVALALAAAALVVVAPGFGAEQSNTAKPYAFKISINGRVLTPSQLTAAADTYIMVKSGGRLRVTASWKNDLRGSGYAVTVFQIGQTQKRRCVSGTSCSAVSVKPLMFSDEIGWTIRITKGSKVVSNKVICIAGAKPA